MTEKKIEEAALLYMSAKKERDHATNRMEQTKKILEDLIDMEDFGERFILFDEDHDIKITTKPSVRNKLDKEELADNMGVQEKDVNQDFLVKSVEDRKLTYEEYKDYHYEEVNNRLQIRLVKSKGEKK